MIPLQPQKDIRIIKFLVKLPENRNIQNNQIINNINNNSKAKVNKTTREPEYTKQSEYQQHQQQQ